jgi:hypothetical protein
VKPTLTKPPTHHLTTKNRETKQRTLEELDQIFNVPIPVFARYQLTKTLPYFIKRWIFFQRHARLEPLYRTGDASQTSYSERKAVKGDEP